MLDQTLEFLFSERGEYLRVRIADELAKEIDKMGYSLLQQVARTLRLPFADSEPVAVTPPSRPQSIETSWEQALRILRILRDTPGFDPTTIATVIPKLVTQPEARGLGRRVVSGVVQRAIARIIREFLTTEPAVTTPALPPARAA